MSSTPDPDEHATKPIERSWRVTGMLVLPVLMVGVAAPPEGGLPARFDRRRRVEGVSVAEVGGVQISLKPWPEAFDGDLELCQLRADIDAPEPAPALERGVPAFQQIAEDFAFQLQQPVRLGQVEALDATPPVCIGDQREITFYPNGYPMWKFGQSQPFGTVAAVVSPTLRPVYEPLERRIQRAFDWYGKALNAPLDVDRFIFLWVVLEILLNSAGALVVGPFVNRRCGHEIANCPDPNCRAPTEAPQRGASVRAFLEALGVQPETANELWDTRQMMHGSKALEQGALAELPRLLQVLQAAVGTRLKVQLGYRPDDPPLVGAGGPSMMVSLPGIGGTREVTAEDLSS